MATLTTEQLKKMAQDYQRTGKELLQYKIDHFDDLSIDEFKTIGSKIDSIFHNANIISALAVYQIGENIFPSLGILTDSTAKMKKALKVIDKVQSVIDLATIIVNIGTSIVQKDVNGIIGNIKNFSEKLKEVSNK
jgi:hypothetical protein